MITPGSVKICSLREPAHADAAVSAGADLFGLIFVPGKRRYVDPATAAAIVARAREIGGARPPKAVGVFVDADAATINAIAEQVGLDFAQLSGGEPPELPAELVIPAIKTVRPSPQTTVADAERLLGRFTAARKPPIAFLIDGYRANSVGGDGIPSDWAMAAALAKGWPLVLAGGLTPETVVEAIDIVRPLAVDVSSGVETDGRKDAEKITAFAAAARRGFAAG